MKEPVWVSKRVVLAMHEELLAEHGGASGLRDETLFDSALARPQNLFSYDDVYLFSLAAAYIQSLVSHHPFIDGNKRIGYVTGGIFLERNGKVLNASEEEATAIMFALAGKKVKEEALAIWLEKNSGRRRY
jgi:death-on-curing protein